MPYVNCPKCGIRSFALAPWSAVNRCPTCEAPLDVPRQSVSEDLRHRSYLRRGASSDTTSRPDEAYGTR